VRRLVFLGSARRDLVEIFDYVSRESGSVAVGRSFTASLRKQCAKLSSLPGALGRERPELHPDVRSFPFRGYVIIFRYADNRLEIIRLIEGHRDVEAVLRGSPDAP
jgi:toxin ParE1/3/4